MSGQTREERGLLARLEDGPVLCAEGYLFELERRGYLQAGPFVPAVVLEHPEAVEQLHRDLVHAGSDVVEALTYYAHRRKLRSIGKEERVEALNREALRIARNVALESGALFAGNLCNTNVFDPRDAKTRHTVRAMFDEQVEWAVDAGVDFVIAETFSWLEEALIALDAARAARKPVVVTLAITRIGHTWEGLSPEASCARLADAGADVVGLNCMRGPPTMLPLLERVCGTVACPVAALPVPFRTTLAEPTFQAFSDPSCRCIPGDRPFPTALDPFTCNRYEMADFARSARALGVRYLGVCCGGGPHHVRAMAEALGRTPAASRYSPCMEKHDFFGDRGTANV